MDDLRRQAIRLHDAFTHEHRDRRRFMAELTTLAGGSAAALALASTIGANPAAAALSRADDPRLAISTPRWTGAGRPLTGYLAAPRAPGRHPPVMVIHENRGLTDHIRDVARRLALAGFAALAPDFLSPVGGTPADADRARDMIGALDLSITTADAVQTLGFLAGERGAKVGAVGFCWGGALVDRTAVAAGRALAAGVSYYGPAPSPAEAARVEAKLLLHYAGLDTRVAATAEPWIAALNAARKPVEVFVYPGVNHAFNNDTAADRYDKPAAALAWERTLAFLRSALA